MAQALLRDLRVDALLEQQCGVAMPEIVEPYARDDGPLSRPGEVQAGDVVGMERLAVHLAEDHAAVRVFGAKEPPALHLPLTEPAQSLDHQ